MWLKGSCHCEKVRFHAWSKHFYPFNLCYCSICRKTAGGTGASINLAAAAQTLRVKGISHTKVYNAWIRNPGEAPYVSEGQRYFCSHCGSFLWLYDATWPHLVHPFASAIDTELPRAPERTHLMLEFRPGWVDVSIRKHDQQFARYPGESIAKWHKRLKIEDNSKPAEEPPLPGGKLIYSPASK